MGQGRPRAGRAGNTLDTASERPAGHRPDRRRLRALGYLDFRHDARNWRKDRPDLAALVSGVLPRVRRCRPPCRRADLRAPIGHRQRQIASHIREIGICAPLSAGRPALPCLKAATGRVSGNRGPHYSMGRVILRPRKGEELVSHAEDDAGTRRDFLYYATAGAGVVATGAAVWPLVNQMNPSADVQALSSIYVDVSGVEVGTQLTVKWRGKPVFIRRRSARRDRRRPRRDAGPADHRQDVAERQQARRRCQRCQPHAGRGRRMAGDDRRLHPSGLRADRRWRR